MNEKPSTTTPAKTDELETKRAAKAAARKPAKATSKAPAKGKASTTRKASGKATTSKAKAPAKGKAAPAKKATEQGVLATKSGVSHPGPLWLKAMHDKGLSQTACATEMGVAPMTLNRLINGHGIPTARVTLAFARVTKQQPKKVWAQVCDFELALAMEQDGGK